MKRQINIFWKTSDGREFSSKEEAIKAQLVYDIMALMTMEGEHRDILEHDIERNIKDLKNLFVSYSVDIAGRD
jgi:hypothetical protein